MNHVHPALASLFACALCTGVSAAAAQSVVVTSNPDGDVRVAYDGEGSAEFVLVTLTVDRKGNVLERTRGRMITLEPGRNIDAGHVSVAGGGVVYDEIKPVRNPVAYTPERDGLPGKRYFVTNLPGLLDDDGRSRRGDLAAGPSGTGKTMDGAEGDADADGDVVYVVTLMSVDEDAGSLRVQPLIFHGAAPGDRPDR